MTAKELQTLLDSGRAAADMHEADLAKAYERVLSGIGRQVARRFRESVTLLAVADDWVPPPSPEDLVDEEAAARSARRRARPVQNSAIEAVATPALTELGISFTVAAPLLDDLLASLELRAGTVAEGIGPVVADVIARAYAEGLSVAETARRILARIDTLKAWQALLLARSDLVAIGNGGSLATVQAARTAGVEVETKTWITAGDERVRPTHVAASGQTVPIDQLFAVGVGSLMYPGDPAGPWEEVANCRCSLTFGERVRPREDVVAEAGLDASMLAMIAVYPRPEEAERLAVDGGLAAEDVHCTLVFLGDADDIDEKAATEAIAVVASELAPLVGNVGGVGRFAEGPDGVPAILLPDVHGLTLLRERVVDELGHRGIRSPSEHGFLPHMTLTYMARGEEIDLEFAEELLGSPLTFDAVSVVIGEERMDYPLEGARIASAVTFEERKVTVATR